MLNQFDRIKMKNKLNRERPMDSRAKLVFQGQSELVAKVKKKVAFYGI